MNYEEIEPFADAKTINAIIETPKGSRTKYSFDPEMQLFRLDKILPSGAVFPYNFGFIPRTKGGDGDPLDVLVIMDDASFPGCLIPCRIIGIIKAKQGKTPGIFRRNDRLLAVPEDSFNRTDVKTIRDLNKSIIKEIVHFFTSYHELRGTRFKSLGTGGAEEALKMIESSRV